MKVLTVIVTYNGRKWIEKCLSSLTYSTMKTDIFIVDNCSSDGTKELIQTSYPNVIFRPQEQNLGFGQGNNVGIKYATENGYDYVLLLNQDAYVDQDMIEILVKNSNGKSLSSPIHMNGTRERIDKNFKRCTLSPILTSSELIDDYISDNLQNQYEVGFICAACWLLPISVINKVGGFNPLFYHYGEDDNYIHRLSYHSIKLYINTQTKVCHDRIVQGNEHLFKKGMVERRMMNEVCNINHNIGTIVHNCLFLCKTYIKTPLDVLIAIYHVFKNTREIIYSRKKDKESGLIWL